MIKFIFVFFMLFFIGCSSVETTKMRGNDLQSKWFKQYFTETVIQKKATPDKSKNYLLKISTLVADEDQKGDPWDKEERTENPDLVLYHVLSDGNKTELGKKENSLTLFAEYPLSLKGQDVITLRLVDTDGTYYGETYGSKYYNDTRRENNVEFPLAQVDLVFEGQGKYFQFSGSAIFIIEIVELVTK